MVTSVETSIAKKRQEAHYTKIVSGHRLIADFELTTVKTLIVMVTPRTLKYLYTIYFSEV